MFVCMLYPCQLQLVQCTAGHMAAVTDAPYVPYYITLITEILKDFNIDLYVTFFDLSNDLKLKLPCE